MNDALYKLIILNSLRAIHAKQVQSKFYQERKSALVEDALKLLETERLIRQYEHDWVHNYYKEEVPKSISVKYYAELMNVSTSTVYRHIKSKDILATKVKGRWCIYTDIVGINEAA